jgi:hypothetical protein
MTDDRTLERAARSWLEEGPTQAPDRAVDAALSRIQTTRQERGLTLPWRIPTMNPITRIAVIAAVVAVAVGAAFFAFRPASMIGPAPSPTAAATIEGTWDAAFSRQEMLAAGIADQGEDNDSNYGHFHLTFQSGWLRISQLAPFNRPGGTTTYTVDGAVAHLFSPQDNVTFDVPYTVTATTLTFGRGGPVALRVKPWTRIATEVITATPEPNDIAAYRQARNAVCEDLSLRSMPPDANPVANPSGAVAVLRSVIARGNDEMTRLSALAAPPELQAEHLASIQAMRDIITLLEHEVDLINQGKGGEVAAVDQQTAPLSRLIEQFEQKYGLAGCP